MTEEGEDSPFICSAPRENGMLRCHSVPPYSEGGAECSLAAPHLSSALISPTVGGASVNGCVNWNQYYNVCRPGEINPHKGAVNFDNIGYAWIAIFQVSMKFQVCKWKLKHRALGVSIFVPLFSEYILCPKSSCQK